MNIVEKILSKASGRDQLHPRGIVEAEADAAMIQDIAGPTVVQSWSKFREERIESENAARLRR